MYLFFNITEELYMLLYFSSRISFSILSNQFLQDIRMISE